MKGTADIVVPYDGGLVNSPDGKVVLRIWPAERVVDFFRQYTVAPRPSRDPSWPGKARTVSRSSGRRSVLADWSITIALSEATTIPGLELRMPANCCSILSATRSVTRALRTSREPIRVARTNIDWWRRASRRFCCMTAAATSRQDRPARPKRSSPDGATRATGCRS